MSLAPALPTAVSLLALERGLHRIARRGLSASLAREHASLAVRSVVVMQRGVRLYHLTLDDLAAGRAPADAARAVGWRFFVPGLRLGQSAEVRRFGRRYVMSGWIEGPDNRRFLEIVARLTAERCAGRHYELRCLEVPALHLTAVWAFASGSVQWFVPVSPLPVAMPAGHTYDAGEFQAALERHAAQRLASKPSTLA